MGYFKYFLKTWPDVVSRLWHSSAALRRKIKILPIFYKAHIGNTNKCPERISVIYTSGLVLSYPWSKASIKWPRTVCAATLETGIASPSHVMPAGVCGKDGTTCADSRLTITTDIPRWLFNQLANRHSVAIIMSKTVAFKIFDFLSTIRHISYICIGTQCIHAGHTGI